MSSMHMKQNMTQHHPQRLLGVFAHPDDESFCAGGTFARYAAHGAEVMVVSATRGEAGQIRSAGTATRRTLARVREQELQVACQRLGIQHARCLDYADGTLKDVDQEVLIKDIVELLRSFRPDVVITFGSDGGYGHPDHIAISAATTAACLRSGDSHHFPEQVAAGLAPHHPEQLYHSHFPPRPQLLLTSVGQVACPGGEAVPGKPGFRLCSAAPLRGSDLAALQPRSFCCQLVSHWFLHHRAGRSRRQPLPDPLRGSRCHSRGSRRHAAGASTARAWILLWRRGAGISATTQCARSRSRKCDLPGLLTRSANGLPRTR